MAQWAFKCVEGLCEGCVIKNKKLCERVYSYLGFMRSFRALRQKGGPVFQFFGQGRWFEGGCESVSE